MGTLVMIWIIGMAVCLIMKYVKYEEFVHYIQLEDLETNNTFDYYSLPDEDRGYPQIYLFRIGLLGQYVYCRPPLPIIREAKKEQTKKTIKQHNFFVRTFWVLFILPIPAAIIFYIAN